MENVALRICKPIQSEFFDFQTWIEDRAKLRCQLHRTWISQAFFVFWMIHWWTVAASSLAEHLGREWTVNFWVTSRLRHWFFLILSAFANQGRINFSFLSRVPNISGFGSFMDCFEFSENSQFRRRHSWSACFGNCGYLSLLNIFRIVGLGQTAVFPILSRQEFWLNFRALIFPDTPE